MVVDKIKILIKGLWYKRFERKVNKARAKGLNYFVVDGLEFKFTGGD